MSEIIGKIENSKNSDDIVTGEPLFKDREEYDAFIARHKRSDLQFADIHTYRGDAYLGIDSGSTTTKMILITEDSKILYSHYQSNNGQPLDIVAEKLKEIYALGEERVNIRGAAVTGYGEDLIKAALKADFGIVETVAHFKAALHFNPKVDFIIDIGGQDIKCFKVKNRAFDHAQRGVFVGLRFVYRNLRQGDEYGYRKFFAAGAVCEASRRTRLALYGIYEQFRKAGAKRGRDCGGYLRGAFLLHRQKRDL